MGKRSHKNNLVYPEEKEGRIKDANRKLKSKVRQLNKQLKDLKEENKQLKRGFNKSCEYISEKIEDKKVEEVIKEVNEYNYKETEKGRKKQEGKRKRKRTCPKCDTSEGKDYKVLDFDKFEVESCNKCGFRRRNDTNEGNKGS